MGCTHRFAFRSILLVLALLLVANTAEAARKKTKKATSRATTTSYGFRVNARSAILIDMSTGRILFEQNADSPIPPASITKVITLYILFDAIREGHVHLWDNVKISDRAASMTGSRMHVRAGVDVSLEELIKGMAVVSGNDACIAVAEHVSGSVETFVKKMNAKARELGMESTWFVNPNGLPAKGQLTTARDIAKLSISYLRRFPESLSIHSMTSYTYNRFTHRNANRLLSTCPGVDGLKTGFVCAAGYNITATAKREDTRLLAVVLGAPGPGVRAAETTKLLEKGFGMVGVGPCQPAAPVRQVEETRPPENMNNVWAVKRAEPSAPQAAPVSQPSYIKPAEAQKKTVVIQKIAQPPIVPEGGRELGKQPRTSSAVASSRRSKAKLAGTEAKATHAAGQTGNAAVSKQASPKPAAVVTASASRDLKKPKGNVAQPGPVGSTGKQAQLPTSRQTRAVSKKTETPQRVSLNKAPVATKQVASSPSVAASKKTDPQGKPEEAGKTREKAATSPKTGKETGKAAITRQKATPPVPQGAKSNTPMQKSLPQTSTAGQKRG